MDNLSRTKSLDDFVKEVKSENRFFRSEKTIAFLEWLHNAIDFYDKVSVVLPNDPFYRARKGSEESCYIAEYEEEDGNLIKYVNIGGIYPRGMAKDYFPKSGMIGSGGRANPEGVPFLYVATTPYVAVSEVRAFLDENVSVAQLHSAEKLRIVDLSDLKRFTFGRYWKESADAMSDEEVAQSVFGDVSDAFSRPIPENRKTLDYLATQIIAEFLHSKGFDGIGYRSQFESIVYEKERDEGNSEFTASRTGGYNIVFFDKNKFSAKSSEIYTIKKKVNFIERSPESRINLSVRSSVDVVAIRQQFGMAEDIFAHYLGVDLGELKDWEKGASQPRGAHFQILKMLSAHPELIMPILKE
ncbi:MAG: RES domain-containing protein [Marinomonas foliarum]|uniref:RES domain-containing protein n=1 Tax=Marinomonas foliarum TaxID=491950 RepID=A0A368ZPQ4_9GAMM|nr:RES domain-containing protein [Marinomonas foliarum]RCW97964.1 RES domain-containing protein [Marinomonas foliarum]